MKRVFGLFLSIMLLAGTIPAGAMTLGNQTVAALPADWEVRLIPDGTSAKAEMTDGNLVLTTDTLTKTQQTISRVTTTAYDVSGGPILFTLTNRLAAQGQGDSSQVVTLTDGSSQQILFSVGQGKLTPLNMSEAAADCGKGEILAAIDPDGGRAAFWLDGALLWSGQIQANLNYAALKLQFLNNVPANQSVKAVWTLADLAVQNFTLPTYGLQTSPEDGDNMIPPASLTEGIRLSFGGEMGPVMYTAAPYTLTAATEEGEAVPVPLTAARGRNGAVQLTPQGGFADRTEYTLTIAQVTDLFGQTVDSQRTLTFTTSYAGYQVPVITPDFEDDMELRQGQETALAYTVAPEPERVEIRKDGQTVATLNQAPYSYLFKAEEPGTAEFQAFAYDAYGGYGASPVSTLTVLANDPPVITVTGVEDGMEYDVRELPQASVSAADTDGVASLTVTLDGRSWLQTGESTLTLPLNQISGGAHTLTVTAADIYGKTASETLHISLDMKQTALYYQNDFSTYTGGTSFTGDMMGLTQRGYLQAGEIDPEHGNSLLIGIDTANTSFAETDTAYVGIPCGGATDGVTVDADLLFSAAPASKFLIAMRHGNGQQDLAHVTPAGNFEFLNGGDTVPMVPGQWYHLRVAFDAGMHTVKAWLDEEQVLDIALAADATVLNFFRIFGPANDAIKCYVAVDNVAVQKEYSLPALTFPELVEPEGPITFTTSAPLDPNDFLPANFSLSSEYGPVEVAAVSGEGTSVTVTPATALNTNTTYTLTISSNVHHQGGPAVGLELHGSFLTAPAPMEILSGTFEKTGTGTRFVMRVANEGPEAVPATVILQVWEGKRVVRTAAQALTLAGGQKEAVYQVDAPSLAAGQRMTAYVWDGLVTPRFVSVRIYETE